MKRAIIIITLLIAGCGQIADNGRAANDGERVFYGDSITAICSDYTDGLNRAVWGMTTDGLRKLTRHFKHLDGEARYTMLIGINDIQYGIEDTYFHRMEQILADIDGREIEIITILPTRWEHYNVIVRGINSQLNTLGVPVIDRYNDFTDNEGLLSVDYTTDGLHLNERGCELLYGN